LRRRAREDNLVHVRSRLFRFAAAVIGALTTFVVLNPARSQPLIDYFVENWQTDEGGLPQNSVTSLVQTSDGYLWIGTFNGLARFDGTRFVVFDAGNTPGFRGSRVTSLYEDSRGVLWIGHETGDLTRMYRGEFVNADLGAAWPGGLVVAIDADEKDDLWALNNDGIAMRLRDQARVAAGVEGGASPGVPLFARARDKRLWVVRGTVFAPIDGREDNSAPPPSGTFQRACASRDGGFWVIRENRIRQWKEGAWKRDLGAPPWGGSFVTALMETRGGNLVVGTLDRGLFVLSPSGDVRHYGRAEGLGHDWVRSLREDLEGGLWVGTGGGGLSALRPRRVRMLNPPNGWEGRAVLSVTPSRDGALWIGTEGAGVFSWRDGKFQQFREANGLYNTYVWSVLETRSRELWVGTWGRGVFIEQEGNFRPAPEMEGSTLAAVALFEGKSGLWVGGENGLGHWNGAQWSWKTNAGNTAIRDVRAICEDPAGAIWFGMASGGLGKLENDQVTLYHKHDGLGGDFVWALRAEPDGTIWIGTFGNGLCRYRQGKFTTISTQNGLPNNVIGQIVADESGFLWFASYGGIFRARRDDLNACADGKLDLVPTLRYGKADGLATLECTGGAQPAACRTPDGKLWFATTKGLAVVDPINVRSNTIPPPIVIEELWVDGKSIDLAAGRGGSPPAAARAANLEIAPGARRFEFHYTGLSLLAPDGVRFRYRLEGWESDWIDAGPRRAVNYSYLPPGRYTFHVTACNNDGLWNETGAATDFVVLPHFWQRRDFIAGTIVAGALAIALAARGVTKQRMRRKFAVLERERAIERERSRIAKDIHDDLGASLTRITLLSQASKREGDSPREAAEALDRIYETARDVTRTMDEIVWAVNPRHDTLDSLVTYLGRFAQEYLRSAKIRCRLDVPIELPAWPVTAEIRHNLFLAFKESLHNIVRHAQATEAKVTLDLLDGGFQISVADNGRGIDGGGSAENSSPDRLATGNGLENIRKRLAEIGGETEMKSGLGLGVTISFRIHLRGKNTVASRGKSNS
jgi:signal transduction histidine kinase/ligand-binding sensor domain-containing protein